MKMFTLLCLVCLSSSYNSRNFHCFHDVQSLIKTLLPSIRYACNTLHVIFSIILISGTLQPFLDLFPAFTICDGHYFFTRYHLARLLKNYPRRPCTLSFVKSRMLLSTTNTFLTFSTNILCPCSLTAYYSKSLTIHPSRENKSGHFRSWITSHI